MNDIVNIWMRFEDPVKGWLVGHIQVVEYGFLAADDLDAAEDFGGGIVEIVGNDDVVSSFEQCQNCKRANVAGATAALRQRSPPCLHPGMMRRDIPGDEHRTNGHGRPILLVEIVSFKNRGSRWCRFKTGDLLLVPIRVNEWRVRE